MKKSLPLPLCSYQHFSPVVASERLVNCFVEQSPPTGKAPYSAARTPGIAAGCNVSTGPGRGIYRWQGQLYAVSGVGFYHISSAYIATLIGGIVGTDLVSFGETPTQLVICGVAASYVYDGTFLTQISDADFANGSQCCSIDGYVLFREEGTGRFFGSDLNDALSYDGLFFATAEGLADNIVGIIADHRQAVLAGTDSMELWYNAGISGFPFIRDANGFIEIGCASGATLAKVDNSVFWLANDKTVRRLDGVTPVRVSTHGVEQAIGTYDATGSYAYGYSQNGHLFYVLTFPDVATWVYDATTQLWHERETYGQLGWAPSSMALAYNRWHVQDSVTGKVGYLDQETYSDWGGVQRMEMTFMDIYNTGDLLIHDSFQVVAETGVGLVTGQGSDPQVTLEKSNDSGRTWVTLPTKSLGGIGEYKKRVKWDALGSSRYRRYRLSISDPIKVVIADALLDVH